jgi:hypothetical protein
MRKFVYYKVYKNQSPCCRHRHVVYRKAIYFRVYSQAGMSQLTFRPAFGGLTSAVIRWSNSPTICVIAVHQV